MFLDARFPSIVFSWLNDFHTCLLCRVVLYDRTLPKRGGGGQGRKFLFMSVTMRKQMYTCSFFFQREKRSPVHDQDDCERVLGGVTVVQIEYKIGIFAVLIFNILISK